MAAENFLVVGPTELKFRFELRKNVPCTLTLQNPTGERVAFKVKTTSPKKYCVRPSSGIVEPGSSKEVQVIMQAQREYPPSLADCKDKFLVQCVKLGSSDAKEVTPDMFDATKQRDIRQTKLRVVLVGPPKPPSPVPEGVEEPVSPATLGYKDAPSSTAGGVVSAAAEDKAEIRKRLEMLEDRSAAGGGRATAQQPAKARGGFGVVHLLLVALLAFLVGHFANVSVPLLTDWVRGIVGKAAGGSAAGNAEL
ncbi:Vesicle-associated 1-2 [Chlorella sorokiniana]|uniref:Vesicle-associated 1-2 n=1 Tax=Chlorella sorokiniana TaxID=3076 RepID=A0A2P6TNC0_CHLSO|nr:Vesicle-associated 1-2 [Chlorella sorokiniana]|eukprot:PRW50828.1 Vesicle-associated 1-2 [Chlorella sorokiniana]